MSGTGPESDGAYFGSVSPGPFDLEALAIDREGTTCHVCDAPAVMVVEMTDRDSTIGSAIYLCDVDFQYVTTGDQTSLSNRLAKNYEEPVSEVRDTAALMTDGTGRSIRLSAHSD